MIIQDQYTESIKHFSIGELHQYLINKFGLVEAQQNHIDFLLTGKPVSRLDGASLSAFHAAEVMDKRLNHKLSDNELFELLDRLDQQIAQQAEHITTLQLKRYVGHEQVNLNNDTE